jgi:hypothetical protein
VRLPAQLRAEKRTTASFACFLIVVMFSPLGLGLGAG